jgi:hypothetical protein
MTAYKYGKALGDDLGGHNLDYLKQELAQAAVDAARYAAINTPAHRANIDYRTRQIPTGIQPLSGQDPCAMLGWRMPR